MRCLPYHFELDDKGVGKCSVPMWCNGMSAGFCDEVAFGKPTEEGEKRYTGYVPGLACFGHGGPGKKPLISPSEPEAGDEERKTLVEHFDYIRDCKYEAAQLSPPATGKPCLACQQIRVLLRQPRTVSREQVRDLVHRLWIQDAPNELKSEFCNILAELDYTIEEPKEE